MTVIIDGCDSEVANSVDAEGCSISDKVYSCEAASMSHGKFRACVSQVGDDLQLEGVLTGLEKDRILSCAGRASIP